MVSSIALSHADVLTLAPLLLETSVEQLTTATTPPTFSLMFAVDALVVVLLVLLTGVVWGFRLTGGGGSFSRVGEVFFLG